MLSWSLTPPSPQTMTMKKTVDYSQNTLHPGMETIRKIRYAMMLLGPFEYRKKASCEYVLERVHFQFDETIEHYKSKIIN